MKKIIKKKFPSFYNFLRKIKDYFVKLYRKSYSQFGEDMVLSSFLFEDKIENGFYVDVGAYHPKKYSNTYFYYKKGWSGINIDAKPGSMELFNKQRRRDINLEVGVSKEEKKLYFYIFKESAYNTFSKELADSCMKNKIPFDKKVEINNLRLENILDKYLPKNKKIDFMSIDVEGLDLQVLESSNWSKYIPTYVLIEMHNFSIKSIMESDIYRFLINKGYKLVSVVYITLIFKYESEF